MPPKRVCIVVLGDVGRSPRMNYHALSLASNSFQVDLIAYKGNTPHEDVMNSENIHLHLLRSTPSKINDLPTFLRYPLKAVWQLFYLFFTLILIARPDAFLVQNPPSIPTLPVVWLVARLRRSSFIIDWHNYGYTILSLALGEKHSLVLANKWIEGFFGRRADANLCVTKALCHHLRDNFSIEARVLYDRPPAMFKPLSIQERHDNLTELQLDYPILGGAGSDSTCSTHKKKGKYQLSDNRPAVIVSSTSWTADEDFDLLINALQSLDSIIEADKLEIEIIFIITGKGPLKEFYASKISLVSWKNISILMPWLSAEQYPKLLASCDLGVCLHASSSGLDLPMKVVDMFGCALPVLSLSYPCIHELVQEGLNGFTFMNSEELAGKLVTLLSDFRSSHSRLGKMRRNLEENYLKLRWNENWTEKALPLFQGL